MANKQDTIDVSDITKLSKEDLQWAWNYGLLGHSPEAEREYQDALEFAKDADAGDLPYDKQTAKELKAEYDRRKAAGRELTPASNKAEAIAALEADDTAQAAEDAASESSGD